MLSTRDIIQISDPILTDDLVEESREEFARTHAKALEPKLVRGQLFVSHVTQGLEVFLDGSALDPNAANWAGIAAFKRAYGIYRERGYQTRLLAAAYRHRLHWTELVGGDVVLTMPYAWQVRFNNSGIDPVSRIDVPVDQTLIDDLLERIPDFRRAYEPDGLSPADFVTFGATARTLRSFVASYHDLVGVVRDIVLPNPDAKLG